MSTPPKNKLSGALGGDNDNINLMWDATQAAEEFQPLPKGDCGKNLNWLRRCVTCEQRFCTVQYVGDKC